MILVFRCEHTESLNDWQGERVWFSPSLSVQRLSIEDGKIVIQVDSAFQTKRDEEKGEIAVVAYGEELSQVEEPAYLTELLSRLKH